MDMDEDDEEDEVNEEMDGIDGDLLYVLEKHRRASEVLMNALKESEEKAAKIELETRQSLSLALEERITQIGMVVVQLCSSPKRD